ncbi:MAG: hypothetical protein DRP62_00100 [Planctomycetota bacterium]|nr:MAG: hypothetical protein DRP62_00100 [Planctomycetota bacterium]
MTLEENFREFYGRVLATLESINKNEDELSVRIRSLEDKIDSKTDEIWAAVNSMRSGVIKDLISDISAVKMKVSILYWLLGVMFVFLLGLVGKIILGA